MFEGRDDVICELLKSQGFVSESELEELKQRAVADAAPIADLAVRLGYIAREALIKAVGRFLGFTAIDQVPSTLLAQDAAMISPELVRELRVVPWRAIGSSLEALAADPFNEHLQSDLAFATGREIRIAVCDPVEVDRLIRQHYPEASTSEGRDGHVEEARGQEYSAHALEDMAGQPPVIRFVNRVLAQGIRERASDIHLEPFAEEFKVRYRVDGVLHEMAPPPRALALPITSRIKVLANLDIAERRLPQDGRIRLKMKERAVDLRVSTLPTQSGESVVLRVLDQSARRLELTELGIPDAVLRGVQEMIRRPHGIFVVTGPTGSGKTTTLYSALRTINAPDLKLLTAEDPVEYGVEGITQVAINPAVGLTFASVMRSFLRQDPDVIMVGEIRDLETAQTAIQASLTGHLVMSTLHTNNATGAITRLVDLGIEPFLVAATLEGILAQRLVRRICANCRVSIEPSEELRRSAGERNVYAGRGCLECNHTGYRGRVGIYEWLPMSEALRELVTANLPTQELQRQAQAMGMRTLREEGLRLAFDGATTLEEVLRHT